MKKINTKQKNTEPKSFRDCLVKPGEKSPYADLLIDLARIGLGIACVPDFCIKSDDPDLFVIPLESALPARRLAVAYDEKKESKIITQFVNLIQTDI